MRRFLASGLLALAGLLLGGVQAASAPFTIETRLLGKPLTSQQQATIREAAARVSQLVASPFAPVTLNLPADSCDDGLPRLKEKVQHFFVFVVVKSLGPDIYGNSAPCDLHDGSYLPIYGVIDLNSDGLDELSHADLLDTMIHEMLHALGVGTLWEPDERVSLSGDSDDKRLARKVAGQWTYTGEHALAAYRALGGQGKAIPLDPDAGHWAGGTVCSEILSGAAGDYTGRVNPVSRITLGALEDLGYKVNAGAADRYTLTPGRCPVQTDDAAGQPTPTKDSQVRTSDVYYASCAAARAAGVTPIRRGQPGYRAGLDGDGDGVACESH
ncbi:excalibur calcium-binding domain-containing protein [Deinococcus ruber]|uniref:Excalibur calcium-binding domain-containing protein n=1 Tax=Deinococcus ruber TaxID=1848197 RepID=A0A918F1R4_9DEIO|nr:excalibur calcium-binding domain-containing protein [Deinococcus ruber]GGQ93021.1 hypothetical protein GCM10008957_01230 [Deinococcus ruber]